ncbi:dihydrofolate reductase family protein [Streptomyces sindenensis]|uniref:Dihydrofolate reductase family protein n=1 Tax=Streptomyces sindenensis TaxID=67363 RepID=A0ABW6EBX1_9ACTN
MQISGGADTVRQFNAAGLLDELQLHIAPVILGAGVRLCAGPGGRLLAGLISRTP